MPNEQCGKHGGNCQGDKADCVWDAVPAPSMSTTLDIPLCIEPECEEIGVHISHLYEDKTHSQECALRYITSEEAKRTDYGCTCRCSGVEPAAAPKISDSERYKWLRSHLEFIKFDGLTTDTCDIGLDHAIDEAIKKEPK